MKITFILPAIGKKQAEPYIETWKMEPLMIAVLQSLTPAWIETEFYDDRIELINYETETDLVAITVETYTAKRAYTIAEEFRKRRKKVVMGGYHATLAPEEVLEKADVIIIGNAESVWAEMLDDFCNGQLKARYQGDCRYSGLMPQRTIYCGKKYLPIILVETGRGCPFNCEFCSISSYYCSKYIPRPVEEIVCEIEQNTGAYYFFVDDNIAAKPLHCRNVVDRITGMGIKWTSQGSLTMVKEPGLLKAMKKSGCDVILIGFESLEPGNLEQMNKGWSMHLGEIDELVKQIHDEGISIYATFVFGFDNDNEDTFKRVIDFSLKHNFFFTAFNHLLPFPGTPLYRCLLDEGRLISERWWLEPDYCYGDIPYKPKLMSPQELSQRCEDARTEFYRYGSIVKRFGSLVKRNMSPMLMGIFLGQNVRLRFEVKEKMRIPLGKGLDEMPK